MSDNPHPPASRYAALPTAEWTAPDGRVIVFLRRRFLPPADRFALLHEHPVAEGDRPDNIAAAHLGDPEQFWRLCDANNVLIPNELTDTPGRRIRITLPEGVPAPAPES